MFWRARPGVPEGSVCWPDRARQEGFGRRWPIPERAVRPRGVVVAPPPLDQHLGFLQRMEDLPLQQFVAELAVEGFIVAVLPWAAALDEQRPHADPLQPGAHHLR